MLTNELRQEAGKFDKILAQLFDDYTCPEKGELFHTRQSIDDAVFLVLANMKTKVSPECHAQYARVYEAIKEVYGK